MSTLRLFLSICAIVSFMVLGSISAYAQAEALTCDQAFNAYSGGKDFMNQEDFDQYWVASGQGQGSNLNPEVGDSGSVFMSANPSGNGEMSKPEFCTWFNQQAS